MTISAAEERDVDVWTVRRWVQPSDRIADFAETCADVNQRDHAAYVAAIEAERISVPRPA